MVMNCPCRATPRTISCVAYLIRCGPARRRNRIADGSVRAPPSDRPGGPCPPAKGRGPEVPRLRTGKLRTCPLGGWERGADRGVSTCMLAAVSHPPKIIGPKGPRPLAEAMRPPAKAPCEGGGEAAPPDAVLG